MVQIMQHSPAGRMFIEQLEGSIPTSYADQGGVWTIGVGHTGREVHAGLVWTQKQVDDALDKDLAAVDAYLNHELKGFEVTQTQWDALASLVFNIGSGQFSTSTVLRKLKAGDIPGAADAFLLWNKVQGKPSKGLAKRRSMERNLFLVEAGD